MAYFLYDYHGHSSVLHDPTDAGEQFDKQASAIMPYGGRGQSIRICSDDATVLDINVETSSRCRYALG